MAILTQPFFNRDTVQVARNLLGCYLVHQIDGRQLICRITETEAYVGRIDKACHAYGYRRTARTEPLFAPPGTAYVYLIYGLHHCLNAVTEPPGEPSAVLLRGGIPRLGTEYMAQNRFGRPLAQLSARQRTNLLNGPGKLCQALGVTRSQNGGSLLAPPLFFCQSLADAGFAPLPEETQPRIIAAHKRIGIDYAQEAAEFPWRFTLQEEKRGIHYAPV